MPISLKSLAEATRSNESVRILGRIFVISILLYQGIILKSSIPVVMADALAVAFMFLDIYRGS
jgi:hypothetical protein